MLGASPLSSFSEGIQLARLTSTPANEWKYQYSLPGDRIAGVRAVFNSGATGIQPIQYGWEILGDKLETSEETIYVDYQYSPNESVLPTYFVQLLKYAMAAEVAETVTDQITKADFFERKAFGTPGENRRGGYFRVAANIDGANNSVDAFQDYTLTAVRQ